ncbi:MAG: amidohydrolase family protein [Saprospiraceae bacterium]|nr:amidohydrolase family protein [Saprospiraceae bacterium]MBP7699546.1 amidohydrolase family protein [Saprospiraceae bacterium]
MNLQRLVCILLSIAFLLINNMLSAQITFPKNGTYDERSEVFAFINATVYKDFQTKSDSTTLVIRKGKIEAIGTKVIIPSDAVIIDVQGKYIYPAFIDLYTNYGLPKPKAVGEAHRQQPQFLTNKKGAYNWNEAIKPEYNAADEFSQNGDSAETWRNEGFGAVLSHSLDGIVRGTSVLVLLGDDAPHELILKEKTANHLSFNKGVSTQPYPSSEMGCIALLRQTAYDAKWYAEQGYKEEKNLSLEAWNNNQSLPQIFEANERLDVLRIRQIAKEFGVQYIVKGVGDEYLRLDEIKTTNQALIIPLNYPEAFDVEDPYDAREVPYAALKHWELAPTNAAALAKENIPFAITTQGIEKSKFMEKLRKTIEAGLSEADALKALTLTPAQLIKADNQLGTLDIGKVANFFIASANVFEKGSVIYQSWINGKAYILKDINTPIINGNYNLRVGNETYSLVVKTKDNKTEAAIRNNDKEQAATIQIKYPMISILFDTTKMATNTVALSGIMQSVEQWSGSGTIGSGQWVDWSATFVSTVIADAKKDDKKPAGTLGAITYPLVPFGWEQSPQAKQYLIRNATVWTNERDGIMRETDVLLDNGKIKNIGKNLTATNAIVIDGTNKHLTAGIIDEHSHIAISRGVNEGSSQESVAEVRIGDVVNSEDINIYRQLSGGVTTAHLLHGSANPIGGQTALIKLRWGFAPEAMKYNNDHRFIKFALGENVKQSNWGDNSTTRFPQSRMGVEQVYDDYFTRAREYDNLKKSGKAYRKDLDLEAIAEIINKQRYITCHSYVQSEINMLMKMAEKHNFRINTFTHILEGYKVADIMAKHGVGGSSFSDWWDYKFEVFDAIPYNGAIMHQQGVLVAFNSDDAETARRLNQEAAKAVLFGGVSEEEAWKFVTLNPAKLLHIDDKVGSLKNGKDADVVLWSDNPLSVYAKAEMTWVDGIKFFDRQEDVALRESVRAERARIIQKMIAAKKGGVNVQPVVPQKQKLYHCDDEEDEGNSHW